MLASLLPEQLPKKHKPMKWEVGNHNVTFHDELKGIYSI